MANFIEKTIFCRYGIPHHIVTDNGVQFQGEVIELLERYGVEHHKSCPYRPQANGAVEAANKEIKRILQRTTQTYRDWADKLPFALWGIGRQQRQLTELLRTNWFMEWKRFCRLIWKNRLLKYGL